MGDYFDLSIAYDPDTEQLVKNATFQVFAVDDLSFENPLALTEAVSGAALPLLRSNKDGAVPQFSVEGDPEEVFVKSGTFVTRLTSVQGRTGPQGKSAFQLAQEAGYAGTEADLAAAFSQAAEMVVGAHVDGDNLILELVNGSTVDAGDVRGPAGPTGAAVRILGVVAAEEDLPTEAEIGDAYRIDDDLWVWDGDSWENIGPFRGEAPEFRITDGHLEYKYPSDVSWTDLGEFAGVSTFADLEGDPTDNTALGAALAALAADNTVVKLTGDQTIAGTKTFSTVPVVPDGSIAQAKVTGLTTDLAAKAADSAVVKLTGNQTIAGTKTFSTTPVVPDNSFGVGKLNASGTKSSTTFLRGDGTWATPASTGGTWGTISGSITDQTDLASELADTPRHVYHDTDPDYPRPDTTRPVVWFGAVEPNNRDDDIDVWWEIAPVAAFEGPLDDYTTPFRAYSLRRLLTSYTGPAIRVRRTTDSAEQDINFTAMGVLDTSALASFADTGSAYVTTWYDQSGNERHLTQTTTAAQPRIVNSGVVDTSGGLPSVVFDGTDDHLKSSEVGLFAAGAASMAAVMSGSSAAAAVFVSEHQAGGNGYYRLLRSSSANWNVQATNDAGTSMWASTVSGSNVFDGNRHQLFYVDASSAISTWKDGTQAHNAIAATRTGSTVPTIFSVGATGGTTPGGFVTGRLQEAVFWTSSLAGSRTAISADQKSYWGTP